MISEPSNDISLKKDDVDIYNKICSFGAWLYKDFGTKLTIFSLISSLLGLLIVFIYLSEKGAQYDILYVVSTPKDVIFIALSTVFIILCAVVTMLGPAFLAYVLVKEKIFNIEYLDVSGDHLRQIVIICFCIYSFLILMLTLVFGWPFFIFICFISIGSFISTIFVDSKNLYINVRCFLCGNKKNLKEMESEKLIKDSKKNNFLADSYCVARFILKTVFSASFLENFVQFSLFLLFCMALSLIGFYPFFMLLKLCSSIDGEGVFTWVVLCFIYLALLLVAIWNFNKNLWATFPLLMLSGIVAFVTIFSNLDQLAEKVGYGHYHSEMTIDNKSAQLLNDSNNQDMQSGAILLDDVEVVLALPSKIFIKTKSGIVSIPSTAIYSEKRIDMPKITNPIRKQENQDEKRYLYWIFHT